MYAEEVYSRIANPDEMVSIRFNQTQHETDKYSKAKRRASKRVKKHFFSETSIILFMLTFFTSSCFLMMFYAPDVIDTVSIKLEEYTIIIDNYLPEGDENSSLIFQTITRDDAKASAGVGHTKTKEELDKQAEEEAYRLLQQADDERMQIAHHAMEKVNAKILLAIQQRERAIRQQRKESARLSRDKSFDETIAREKKRLQNVQVHSKTGRKKRPRSIFINGQEIKLDEDVPTPDNLRKDPHVHIKVMEDSRHDEKMDTNVEEKFHNVAHESKRDVDQNKREVEKDARKANGKLPIKLDKFTNVENTELKMIVPDAEQVKADSEYLVEIGGEVQLEEDLNRKDTLKVVDRKVPIVADEDDELLADLRENEKDAHDTSGKAEVDNVLADLLKTNKEKEIMISLDTNVEEELRESASNVEMALVMAVESDAGGKAVGEAKGEARDEAEGEVVGLQTNVKADSIDMAVEKAESDKLEAEVSNDDYPDAEPTTAVEAAHDDDLVNILGDLQDLNQDIFDDKYV